MAKIPSVLQPSVNFMNLAKKNGGTKNGRVTKEFYQDSLSGKYGEEAKTVAQKSLKKSGQLEKLETEAATKREKAKADNERKKAATILARSQRARGGGSYEANPTSSKLG